MSALIILAALLASSGQTGQAPVSPDGAAAELEGGHYAEAARDYRLIVKAYPQMAEAYTNLGLCYFLQKQYPQAIATFRDGLKLKPDMANAWLFLGISLFDSNQPSE